MPEFSIITINLNNKQGLERTIASVTAQTFKDYEYVIIDGGSVDGSVDIIHLNEKDISDWVSEKDGGIYNAMNKGLRMAKGKYLLFLNSGDELSDRDSLRRISERTGDKDFVYCDVQLAGDLRVGLKNHPDHITTRFLLTGMICHQAIFARRELFDKTGPFDEQYKIYADYEWMLRAIKVHNASTRHIPRVLVRYQEIGISNTSSPAFQRKEKDAIHDKHFGVFLLSIYRFYRFANDWLSGNLHDTES